MSQLVVGKKSGDGWILEVADVGTTQAASLADIEPSVRALLREHGDAEADTRDLQLLMPDFEVDLSQHGVPGSSKPDLSIVAGLILLTVMLSVVVTLVVLAVF